MKRTRRHPYSTTAGKTEPFDCPEDAWFWAMQCMIARRDGARHIAGMALHPRPCDPDDVLIVLGRLHTKGRLSAHHVRVMQDYGLQLTPPDGQARGERMAATLWDEALDAMRTPLCAKGIVK